MKHFFCTLVLVLFLASFAQADNLKSNHQTGFYIAAGVSMASQESSDAYISSSTLYQRFGDRDDTSHGGSLAAGYDFNPAFHIPVRVELEYMIRSEAETVWTGDQGIFISGPLDWEVKAKTDLDTLLLHFFYDFKNQTAFTPYLSGGIGFAFIDSMVLYEDSNANIFNGSSDETNFAWSLGAGCSYTLNENWGLTLGYRYLDAGTREVKPASLAVKVSTDVRIHEMIFSVQYRF
ncbi:outer membrane protein [Desulfospira joergensenii]|uniref:outer membrane protein n=1 Tax=Desulfospira joergensenii TaxID=53329 RepID=UPI0003B67E27|nr:outer membrane beta-barrel protein [Desulfospira joergensenii]